MVVARDLIVPFCIVRGSANPQLLQPLPVSAGRSQIADCGLLCLQLVFIVEYLFRITLLRVESVLIHLGLLVLAHRRLVQIDIWVVRQRRVDAILLDAAYFRELLH